MRNPFTRNKEAIDDLYDYQSDMFSMLAALALQVEELREEVDFLIDLLDD
jgi:hypothetical protein